MTPVVLSQIRMKPIPEKLDKTSQVLFLYLHITVKKQAVHRCSDSKMLTQLLTKGVRCNLASICCQGSKDRCPSPYCLLRTKTLSKVFDLARGDAVSNVHTTKTVSLFTKCAVTVQA